MTATIEHDFLHDAIVQIVNGEEIPGFLLTRSATQFFAYYPDGVVEEINPPQGFPRPDPDPADRTQRVSLPTSFLGTNPLLYKHASRYSGLMRRVVQCEFSRGVESRFDWRWTKTHGILEYPKPRQIGDTKGEEAANVARRRQWIIEISNAGVFAAPMAPGHECLTCATDIGRYVPVGESVVNLAASYAAELSGVERLLDAAGIAPAFAAGTVWYDGMGWAFSWSGWAASNVVHKTIFDGDGVGLTDYYETRMLDLAFDVTFEEGATVTEITAAGGVATVIAPGHGFAVGDLCDIRGAEPDDYNGAHVVDTVTDSSTFTFSVATGVSSPAGGEPVIANANGEATITAALTVGSPGRVTFRNSDKGTLWVPSDLFFGEWDGIRPFANTPNVSGPVHVFYDGEEKITTTWSSAISQIPAESQGAVNMASVGPAPEITWIGPISQIDPGSVQVPGHECQHQGRETIYEDGHSYGTYTNIAWGFSGPFDLAVTGFSRSRINTTTGPDGGLFHEAAYDWGNGGGFACCGGVGSAVAYFNWETWSQKVRYETITSAQSASGTSALILLPSDREAVAGIKKQREFHHDSHSVRHALLRANEWRVRVTDIVNNGCVGTPIPHWPRVGSYYEQGGDPIFETTSETFSSSFSLRASGGINHSGPVTTTLDNFSLWQAGVKEIADSSLFFMRGGLENGDPGLSPVDQTGNYVEFLGDAYTLASGFAAIPAGRDPVAYIGQV